MISITKKPLPLKIITVQNKKFFILKKEIKTAKNGHKYLKLIMLDNRNKETIGILFNVTNPLPNEGDTVKITGKLKYFKKRNSITIERLKIKKQKKNA